MYYLTYSINQLEAISEKLIQEFDPSLLQKPKVFDVYSVIDKCLQVDYSWHYIRPDQAILGMTAFSDGYYWVSPTPYRFDGMLPEKIFLRQGEIVIDTTLTEGNNRGRENFTVMHEAMHQRIHK